MPLDPTRSDTYYLYGRLAQLVYPISEDGWSRAQYERFLTVVRNRPAEVLTGGFAKKLHALEGWKGELRDRIVDMMDPENLAPPCGEYIKYELGYYHQAAALEKLPDLTPTRLREVGEAMYGDRWQCDLARALGVGDRRVREYAAGERSIPKGMTADIWALAKARGHALSMLSPV